MNHPSQNEPRGVFGRKRSEPSMHVVAGPCPQIRFRESTCRAVDPTKTAFLGQEQVSRDRTPTAGGAHGVRAKDWFTDLWLGSKTGTGTSPNRVFSPAEAILARSQSPFLNQARSVSTQQARGESSRWCGVMGGKPQAPAARGDFDAFKWLCRRNLRWPCDRRRISGKFPTRKLPPSMSFHD